jgi:hypothetical protein
MRGFITYQKSPSEKADSGDLHEIWRFSAVLPLPSGKTVPLADRVQPMQAYYIGTEGY